MIRTTSTCCCLVTGPLIARYASYPNIHLNLLGSLSLSLSLQSIAMLEEGVLRNCYPVLRTLHAMLGAGSAVHVHRRTDCTGAE
jgi:hypothetical protein